MFISVAYSGRPSLENKPLSLDVTPNFRLSCFSIKFLIFTRNVPQFLSTNTYPQVSKTVHELDLWGVN